MTLVNTLTTGNNLYSATISDPILNKSIFAKTNILYVYNNWKMTLIEDN
jgi:hypothetical protein